MSNYFKVKEYGLVEINNMTIESDGKKGLGNAAEQFVSEQLSIPIEAIKEITKAEYDKLSES